MNDEYNNNDNNETSEEIKNDTIESNTVETESQADTTFTSQQATSTEEHTEGSQQQAETAGPQDPYSKYNYYPGNQFNQGYPNQGYQNQGYQNPGYMNQGYPYQGQPQNPQGIYSSVAPQYSGTYQANSYQQNGYQNTGYQNTPYGQNPYPTGRISYVNNVDSIYPGTAPHKTQTNKEKSKLGKFFVGLAMSVAFGVVAAGVFILVTYFYKQQNPELFSSNTTPVQVTTTDSKKDNQLNLDPAEGTKVPSTSVIDGATFTGTDVSNVVEENMPAIVAIDCITQSYNYWYGSIESPSAGSGIIIHKNDKELMIATNNHVIEDTTDIKVKFIDGTSAPAKIKGTDKVADLAILSINLEDISEDTLKAITIAKLGNSDEIKVGEMAIAIGNALGYGQSVTVGYLSAKDRELTIDGQTYSGLLQTDAAINPGNSGGALLNIKGEVIGINNAKIGGSDVEGMGYAIPITKAQDIIFEYTNRENLTTEEQGYLGISISTVSKEMSQLYNWPIGSYVAAVEEDSAAQKGGLLVGDIITKVDNFEITTKESLIDKIQSLRYGTDVTLVIQRRVDGEFQEITLTITLGQRPTENANNPE